MDDHYMADPSNVFKSFLEYNHRSQQWRAGYQAGVMAMALELITVAKTIEALPSPDPVVPEEIISTIYTLLNGMDLTEQATLWYERVSDWRRPKFVGEHAVAPSGVALVGQLSLLPDPESSSSGVSPLGAAARLGTLHAPPHSDQSRDLTSSQLALLRRGEVATKRTGLSKPPGEIGRPADD